MTVREREPTVSATLLSCVCERTSFVTVFSRSPDMALKVSASEPISSPDVTAVRCVRSPCAISFALAARSSIGRTMSRAARYARPTAMASARSVTPISAIKSCRAAASAWRWFTRRRK